MRLLNNVGNNPFTAELSRAYAAVSIRNNCKRYHVAADGLAAGLSASGGPGGGPSGANVGDDERCGR